MTSVSDLALLDLEPDAGESFAVDDPSTGKCGIDEWLEVKYLCLGGVA